MNELFLLNRPKKGKKPHGQYKIDWSHPLTRKLEFFYISSHRGINYRKNTPPTTVIGSPTVEARYTNFNADSYQYKDIQDIATSGRSIIVKARLTTNDSYRYFLNAHNYDSEYEMILATDAGGELKFFTANTGNQAAVSGALSTNVWYTIGGIKSPAFGQDGRIFLDENELSPTYIGNTAPTALDGNQIGIGGRESGGRDLDGDMEFAAFWSRDLSEAEYQSFRLDPYQILKPVNDPVYFISTGATNPVAVNDAYDVVVGVQLVVSAELGILANDTYGCS